MKTVGAVAVGLLFWLAAQILALGLADGGDGWDGPAALSLALILFCPAVFARLIKQQTNSKLDGAMLIIAASLDAILFYNIQVQEPGYFAVVCDVAPVVVAGWFMLWAAPQLIALAVFARSARSRTI